MTRNKTVRVAVLRTAGTNCDVETAYAFTKVGALADRVHVNRFVEKKGLLDGYQVLALPGGFSYGDDIASGKLLANELRYRLEDEIRRFKAEGKLIIGICNGFQVLVKAGLLPGTKHEATLTNNDSGKFEDRWVYLKSDDSCCVFLTPACGATCARDLLYYLPVAHGEGKFVASPAALKEIRRKKMLALEYVGPGDETAPQYPWNPNGSMEAIAGICDPTGRIFGLMPHPERHIEPTQHPRWTRDGLQKEGDGVRIFRNAVEFARKNLL